MEIDDKVNIYQGPRGTAIRILNRVERTDAYLDKLLDIELNRKEISDLDKGLLNEIVHGVIRWKNRLDWVINGFYNGNYHKTEINLKNALRVAAYQILFLQRIPNHAAVNESVEFIKRLNGEKAANLVNAVLRNIIRNLASIRYPEPEVDAVHYLSVYYSYPNWMVKRWLPRFGYEETEKLLIAYNQIPGITIRINKMRCEPAKFLSILDAAAIQYHGSEYIDYYLKITNLTVLSNLNLFQDGCFSIQDESAALPTMLLNPQPGERVIDLCAAPGGKTTHIAELMRNQGSIIAVDKYDYKLGLIKTSCERLGITIVDYKVSDAGELDDLPADKVLADVPCSGLGVLRKKPDIKWKRDISDINKLIGYQKSILENAAKLTKPGGVIVYSTCTTEPEENMLLIQEFLKSHPEFSIDDASKYVNHELVNNSGCVETFPHKHHMDGSFAVRLVKSS
ncbi:MAG: 16S rRNA (cytosine(967)-C(5))-methyltransferase RsmB [Nanoarchaeota archaeon]|nr:16S rRNA (cytosine(967)-C(5))-methyltransferase RsmB [Nanoarchaeota archaeon]